MKSPKATPRNRRNFCMNLIEADVKFQKNYFSTLSKQCLPAMHWTAETWHHARERVSRFPVQGQRCKSRLRCAQLIQGENIILAYTPLRKKKQSSVSWSCMYASLKGMKAEMTEHICQDAAVQNLGLYLCYCVAGNGCKAPSACIKMITCI